MNTIFTPIPEKLRTLCAHQSVHLAGNCIQFPERDFTWEHITQYDIALIGIKNEQENLYPLREEFYKLYLHGSRTKIVDLGDIVIDQTDSPVATHEKIESALQSVLRHNIFVIVLGQSPLYINYTYNALKTSDDSISLSYISNTASLGNAADSFSAQNHLAYLLNEYGEKLFNLNIIGYQLYQTDPDSLDLLNKHFCQSMRLGALRNDFKSVEPILRDTDLLAINMSSVRQCDASSTLYPTPNGLYAEEVCQLVRYSSISDRLRLASIVGFDTKKDSNTQTNQLLAQIIWHLIDGYLARKNDSPLKNVNGIKKYIVDMGAPTRKLVFYYSGLSERWWMEVQSESSEKCLLIACSHDDYRSACQHEIPLRWVWFHQKLSRKFNLD